MDVGGDLEQPVGLCAPGHPVAPACTGDQELKAQSGLLAMITLTQLNQKAVPTQRMGDTQSAWRMKSVEDLSPLTQSDTWASAEPVRTSGHYVELLGSAGGSLGIPLKRISMQLHTSGHEPLLLPSL